MYVVSVWDADAERCASPFARTDACARLCQDCFDSVRSCCSNTLRHLGNHDSATYPQAAELARVAQGRSRFARLPGSLHCIQLLWPSLGAVGELIVRQHPRGHTSPGSNGSRLTRGNRGMLRSEAWRKGGSMGPWQRFGPSGVCASVHLDHAGGTVARVHVKPKAFSAAGI